MIFNITQTSTPPHPSRFPVEWNATDTNDQRYMSI